MFDYHTCWRCHAGHVTHEEGLFQANEFDLQSGETWKLFSVFVFKTLFLIGSITL